MPLAFSKSTAQKLFLGDREACGLVDPILVVTDGAPGLIRALEECLPSDLHQRHLTHKLKN